MLDSALSLWDSLSFPSMVLWVITVSIFVVYVSVILLARVQAKARRRSAIPASGRVLIPGISSGNVDDGRPASDPIFPNFQAFALYLVSKFWGGSTQEAPPGLRRFAIRSTYAGIAFLASSLLFSVWDLTILRELGVTSRRLSPGVTLVATEGRDSAGRVATFDIIVLSREYFWRFGSSTSVVDVDGNMIDVEAQLLSPGVRARGAAASDLIAAGTASCIGGREEEESRALERADTIAGWLRHSGVFRVEQRIYLLSLGKYTKRCESGRHERHQRNVVIVGVAGKESGVNITESFRDALLRARRRVFLHVELDAYSNWAVDRFQLLDAT